MKAPRLSPTKVVEIALVAALYAVITWALAPISYSQFQFRVSEIMKSIVIWEPHLILAFVLGNFLSNLSSPYAGPWELIFMPVANLIGGSLCYLVGRRWQWVGAFLYATAISVAVSIVLTTITKVPATILWGPIQASETILIVGGLPVMRLVRSALKSFRQELTVNRGQSV